MPSHEVHRRVRELLGLKGYDWVDDRKDKPYKVLGRRHRILYHDPATNLVLALETGDPKAFLAGALHDILDFTPSLKPKLKRRRFLRHQR